MENNPGPLDYTTVGYGEILTTHYCTQGSTPCQLTATMFQIQSSRQSAQGNDAYDIVHERIEFAKAYGHATLITHSLELDLINQPNKSYW